MCAKNVISSCIKWFVMMSIQKIAEYRHEENVRRSGGLLSRQGI